MRGMFIVCRWIKSRLVNFCRGIVLECSYVGVEICGWYFLYILLIFLIIFGKGFVISMSLSY